VTGTDLVEDRVVVVVVERVRTACVVLMLQASNKENTCSVKVNQQPSDTVRKLVASSPPNLPSQLDSDHKPQLSPSLMLPHAHAHAPSYARTRTRTRTRTRKRCMGVERGSGRGEAKARVFKILDLLLFNPGAKKHRIRVFLHQDKDHSPKYSTSQNAQISGTHSKHSSPSKVVDVERV
jgi:hypothetical protein